MGKLLHLGQWDAVSRTRRKTQSTDAVPSQPFQSPSHSCRIWGNLEGKGSCQDILDEAQPHKPPVALCYVEELYTTNGFTSLNNKKSKSEQQNLLMSTYLTQCQNVGRMEKHADTDLHIQANVCECHWQRGDHRVRHYRQIRHWKLFVTRISNRVKRLHPPNARWPANQCNDTTV